MRVGAGRGLMMKWSCQRSICKKSTSTTRLNIYCHNTFVLYFTNVLVYFYFINGNLLSLSNHRYLLKSIYIALIHSQHFITGRHPNLLIAIDKNWKPLSNRH